MAGSYRHWRDVYTAQHWKKIIENTSPLPAELPADLVPAIEQALTEYHAIEKRSAATIKARQTALMRVAGLSQKGLKVLSGSGERIQKQIVKRGRGTRPGVTLHIKSDIRGGTIVGRDKSFGPWLNSLYKTSLKKHRYLSLLDGAAAAPFRTIGAFNVSIQQRLQEDPPEGLLRLTPGTSLEQADPLHRPFEHTTAADGTLSAAKTDMSRALVEWLASGSPLNFMIWLEGHDICTVSRHFNPVEAMKATQVQYHWDPEVRQVWIGNGGLVARPALSNEAPIPLSTRSGGSKPGEAFVWAPDGALFCHVHQSGHFHHSSFRGGGDVRCAGTFGATGGIVDWMDNNSGHYQPQDRHFLTFVSRLSDAGVLKPTARFGTHTIHEGDKQMASLPYAEYVRRAREAGARPFPAGGAANGLIWRG